MKSLAYLKKLTAAIENFFDEDFGWVFEEAENNVAAATAGINTVAGAYEMSIYCDGASVFPFIIVAQLTDDDMFTDEEMFHIYETINKVNHLYGNLVVPVIAYEESSVFLRGIKWATFQDDLPAFGLDKSPVFQYAAGNIIDFINAVNEDYGTTHLYDLLKLFEESDGSVKN